MNIFLNILILSVAFGIAGFLNWLILKNKGKV